MSLVLRLSLLPLLIAGCAAQSLVVEDSDWQTVPAAQREEVERRHEANLAAARAEITTASASLAALQRSQSKPAAAAPAAPTAPPAPTTPTPADPGENEEAAASREHEQARANAVAQIEEAKAAWQRADLTWQRLRVDAAHARLAAVVQERELVRAQLVDRNLVGTDRYDVAPLRGQFSRAQQRWHSAVNAAKQAREVLVQASATLTSAKEAYAQIMRGGPLPSQIDGSQPSPPAAPAPGKNDHAQPGRPINGKPALEGPRDSAAAASAKPAAPASKPAAPASKPAAPAIKPAASAKPASKPAAPAIKPAAPAIKPAASAKPAAPAIKPAASAKPAAPAIKPAASAKPAAPAIKPADSAKPAAPAIKPAASAKPAAPAIKPAASAKPAAPAIKPAVRPTAPASPAGSSTSARQPI
jgi:hypothetical protein